MTASAAARARRGLVRTLALPLTLLATSAHAVVDVRIGSCTVIVSAPGTLTPSPDLKTLSTANPNGRAGRFRVSTLLSGTLPHLTCSLVAQLNCFRITVLPATQFSVAPPGWDGAVSFSGRLRPVGTIATLDVLSAVVLNGDTDFELDLTATRLGGAFPAGTFQTEETVRCE